MTPIVSDGSSGSLDRHSALIRSFAQEDVEPGGVVVVVVVVPVVVVGVVVVVADDEELAKVWLIASRIDSSTPAIVCANSSSDDEFAST